MEANVREVRMGKAKGRRETKRSREETEKGKIIEVKKVAEEWEI